VDPVKPDVQFIRWLFLIAVLGIVLLIVGWLRWAVV
jgi:hypothetical protein